jgi:predicted small lipoprotein YifL
MSLSFSSKSTFFAAFLAGVLLSGCGVKGDLEPPTGETPNPTTNEREEPKNLPATDGTLEGWGNRI